MYYTIYKITNLINNMEYIGAHKTKKLDDGYMGSGTDITDAIIEYGIDNFEKEILHLVEDSELMYFVEKLIVDKEYVLRENTYNLKTGGHGGFDHLNSDYETMVIRNSKAGKLTDKTNAVLRLKWLRENDTEWVTRDSEIRTTAQIKVHAENPNRRKKNSEIQKKLIWVKNISEKICKRIDGAIVNDFLKSNKLWKKGRIVNRKHCIICDKEFSVTNFPQHMKLKHSNLLEI